MSQPGRTEIGVIQFTVIALILFGIFTIGLWV